MGIGDWGLKKISSFIKYKLNNKNENMNLNSNLNLNKY